MSRWKDADQMPWNIGAGISVPNARQMAALARMANWYGASRGPGSTLISATFPAFIRTTKECLSMSSM